MDSKVQIAKVQGVGTGMVKLKPFVYQPVLLVRVGHVRIAEHVSIHVHESVV